MKSESLAYPYIVIEGNIGVGKTTFCRKLQEKYDARLILEQFSENPFLPFFYENPERHAFSVELFFMTERHRQLQEELIQGDLFNQQIISDYIFIKTLLFAKNNLNEEEYRLFNRLFHVLNAHFKKPDLVVYLHRPVPNLLHQIKKRGRSFEMEINATYLENIQKAYFDFFKMDPEYPILVVGIDDIDFEKDNHAFELLNNLLLQNYEPKVHYINLKITP
ncbi:MAG: deoxynucleoside kinase [Bacteroidota bacterium]|jgi:deoxyadenosine/deoxycytidine kinase